MSSEDHVSIEGTILMLDDKTPHVAVPAQAIRDGEVIATTLSDESGRYQFTNLEPGQYQLRCQVLGGYVYYRATEHALCLTSYDSGADDSGDILDVQRGKTLRNTDFRFAPFKKGTWRHYSRSDGLAHNTVNKIYFDPDGFMWLGTDAGGISRYDGKEFVNFTSEDGLPVFTPVWCIHRDPDGIMWFGLWQKGVYRYDGKSFIDFARVKGMESLARGNVTSIERDFCGVIWFSTNYDIYKYDEIRGFEHLAGSDLLMTEDGFISHIYQTTDGKIWFMTSGGAFLRYDGEKFDKYSLKEALSNSYRKSIKLSSDHPDRHYMPVYTSQDGTIWVGLSSGAYGYDGTQYFQVTTDDGLLPFDRIMGVQSDPDGTVWIGALEGGISRYDGANSVRYNYREGWESIFNTIRLDAGESLWKVGVPYDGVSKYDGKEFIRLTQRDGLADDLVRAVYPYIHGLRFLGRHSSDGIIWFGTDSKGAMFYDGTAWSSLDTQDGMAGDTIVAIADGPDGSLWFATRAGGLTRYNRSSSRPRAYIVSVTTDKTYCDLSAIPAFVPGLRVTIEYSSIDFKTIPEKRQYRCRVKEIDSDWQKPAHSNTFDHIFHEPGTYTFEVQAIDRDLNYSEPASVKLEVIPDPRNHRIIQLEEHIHQQELAELERVHQELEDARQIQLSLLPKESPQMAGYEIAGTSLPAREVSGDFYTYLSLGKNTGIVLADVTGKSVKAAMIATLTDGMLNEAMKSRRELWNSPGMILGELNVGLQPRLMRGMFVAMSLGILQTEEKCLTFSNSGMPYPIVKRGDEVRELEVNGLPLGLMSGVEYDDMAFEIEPGDFLVFYSDGVIEATDEAGEMYQTESLLEVVKKADSGIPAQEMMDLVVRDVTAFVGDEEVSDDITIVVLRRKE
jgi:serine phosphatase RsbU (regulator of sigma subunit)/ligand-binding sensor domain-containing protein